MIGLWSIGMALKVVHQLGYRMVTGLLNGSGCHNRVERIWRREGLKVPRKYKKKERLWLNHRSCVRQRPERTSHR